MKALIIETSNSMDIDVADISPMNHCSANDGGLGLDSIDASRLDSYYMNSTVSNSILRKNPRANTLLHF